MAINHKINASNKCQHSGIAMKTVIVLGLILMIYGHNFKRLCTNIHFYLFIFLTILASFSTIYLLFFNFNFYIFYICVFGRSAIYNSFKCTILSTKILAQWRGMCTFPVTHGNNCVL